MVLSAPWCLCLAQSCLKLNQKAKEWESQGDSIVPCLSVVSADSLNSILKVRNKSRFLSCDFFSKHGKEMVKNHPSNMLGDILICDQNLIH